MLSMHLVIGMHGAAMVHGMHLAAADLCGGPTSVLELLPRDHSEWGIAHLVSYAGRPYRRWNNADPARETTAGTLVDVVAFGAIVEEALRATLQGQRKGS